MISMEMLQDARRVLSPVINQTPVLHAPGLVPDCSFYLKADCLQKTGAFKLRGAYYKIATLSDQEKRRGVIACSAGNHAQGVGFASRDMHIPATICIPAAAPISKIQATRSYGANVVLVDGVYDDAYAEAVRLRDEQGLTFIHPFDDYRVMAGQGTIGLEILEQLPDVDVILVPIGGGGLISGLAYAVKHLKPSCQVIGVQAAGAASMVNSLEAGHILTLPSVHTIADGIQVKTPGDLTFEMCRQYVDKVVTVSESEIAAAILTILEKQKLITEGAGAVSVAAVMAGKLDVKGKTVCALLSGGNVDVTGLIVACDILEQLPQDLSGVMLFVPKLMFNADGMTLDEYHRDDLLASLTSRGAEVHVVSTMPHELLDTLEHILGITPANSTIPADPTH